ncbi:histidine phosphatase family protein [Streptomyces sp. C10-9-1]|uniref:histidine phosphatase family protein n=1 Tax=Streptomyces sp. C10-9-1 TaxID=1859285 RepID=UPI003D73FDCE
MNTQHIYLIKHGETEENLQGIHQGRAVGGRLSERGRADIGRVGACLAAAGVAVDQMLVSPMSRCRESAELLAAALSPADVGVDERLAAKDSGHLGGRPRELAAAEAARHGVPIHRLRTPGGESSEDVQARYVDLLDEVSSGGTANHRARRARRGHRLPAAVAHRERLRPVPPARARIRRGAGGTGVEEDGQVRG